MTKNKGKLSRIFFWPFFSVLRVFAPHESRALYRDRVLAPPRCDEIAAWRLCIAKISVSKIFADQVGGKKFQRQTANAPNGRLAFKTRRSSHAWLKLSRPQRRNRSNSMKLPPLACRYRITLLTCPGLCNLWNSWPQDPTCQQDVRRRMAEVKSPWPTLPKSQLWWKARRVQWSQLWRPRSSVSKRQIDGLEDHVRVL